MIALYNVFWLYCSTILPQLICPSNTISITPIPTSSSLKFFFLLTQQLIRSYPILDTGLFIWQPMLTQFFSNILRVTYPPSNLLICHSLPSISPSNPFLILSPFQVISSLVCIPFPLKFLLFSPKFSLSCFMDSTRVPH